MENQDDIRTFSNLWKVESGRQGGAEGRRVEKRTHRVKGRRSMKKGRKGKKETEEKIDTMPIK